MAGTTRRGLLRGAVATGIYTGVGPAIAVGPASVTRNRFREDPRIDPRLRAVLSPTVPTPDVTSREELLLLEQTESARTREKERRKRLAQINTESIAPSTGLTQRVESFRSNPDNNVVKVHFVRPDCVERLPCIFYLHGGGMMSGSCFDGNYQAWGRILAAQGVAVAMVDFRNSLRPSSATEIAPFPAGLNDCVSGLGWLYERATTMNIDPERIVIAGDSGGGNLTLATGLKLKQMRQLNRIKGVYAMCPYIAGRYPDSRYPSTIENNGILLELHNNRGLMAYGIEAYERRDPLAWPSFAGTDDVCGLPPTVISVNECDPLRDEGIAFYRLLLSAGVQARCRQVMGTIHATEIFPAWCPEISRDTALHLASFASR